MSWWATEEVEGVQEEEQEGDDRCGGERTLRGHREEVCARGTMNKEQAGSRGTEKHKGAPRGAAWKEDCAQRSLCEDGLVVLDAAMLARHLAHG